jgi:drug/metabolite transporter (DMT)-like permease
MSDAPPLPPAAAANSESRPWLAAAWMVGAILCFTSLAVAGRELAGELDTFEIMFYRSVLGVGMVVGVAALFRRLHEIKTNRLRTHAVRNVFHFTGQNLWFFAITVAPLAQVIALEFTMPLWAMLLAVVVLGERLTGLRVGLAFLGFSGILIITRPWEGDISIGVVTAALAAIGFAGSAVWTRLLTRHESATSIVFWLVVMQSVLGLVTAGWDGQIAWPSSVAWPWLWVVAIAGLVAHFCLTKALGHAPATVVIPIDFARLPTVALVGLWLYAEPLDPFVAMGAAIIFAAAWGSIRAESRDARRRSTRDVASQGARGPS